MTAVGFTKIYKHFSIPGYKILLTHDPARLFNPNKSGKTLADTYNDHIFVTGHRHNDMPQRYKLNGYNIINVGVYVWNYAPVPLEEILQNANNKR